MLKKIVSLLLALALVSGPAALAVDWVYPAADHPDVSYADMLPVEPFDETELQAALDELESCCALHRRDGNSGETRGRVLSLYSQIRLEMNVLITRTNLAHSCFWN